MTRYFKIFDSQFLYQILNSKNIICFSSFIYVTHQKIRNFQRTLHIIKQECIPVGCVPSAH